MYIEDFLRLHAEDVRGACLEVLNADYTVRFGGSRVSRRDVLDIDPTNTLATIVADLGEADSLPAERFDCVIFTQTLHLVPDMRTAVANVWRSLVPGGVLLLTVPALGRHDTRPGSHHDRWRVTRTGLEWLLSALPRVARHHVDLRQPPHVHRVPLWARRRGTDTRGTAGDRRPVPPDRRRARGEGTTAVSAGGTLVLLYHRVAHLERDPHGLAVRPDRFAEQCEVLRRRCTVVPLAQSDRARREVAITFDDGYADNAGDARRILAAAGLPATFFITAGRVGEGPEAWWDRLERIVLGCDTGADALELDVDGRRFWADIRSATARERAHWALFWRLRPLRPAAIESVLDELQAQLGVSTLARRPTGG